MSATVTPVLAAVSHWIDGKEVVASSGRGGVVTNPATARRLLKLALLRLRM